MFSLKRHDWHTLVMILCFVYSGIAIVLFITQFATFVQFSAQSPPWGTIASNTSAEFHMPTNMTSFRERPYNPRINTMFYVTTILSLFGAIVSLLAGFSLLSLLKKKERKKLTKDVISTMTTPEEKLVIGELEENGGELTQSELVRRTKLSKVKVHRIVKRLESLKVVSKYPYGVTNKIKLEHSIYKEKSD